LISRPMQISISVGVVQAMSCPLCLFGNNLNRLWPRRKRPCSVDFFQAHNFLESNGATLFCLPPGRLVACCWRFSGAGYRAAGGSAIGLLSPPRPGAVPLRVMGLTIPHDNEALGHAGCALRRRSALEPATPAVPAATEKNQHNDEDYKKCRRVHAALLARLPT
jgi:hypothetical protein